MTKFYMGGVQQVQGADAAARIYDAVTNGGSVVITVTKPKGWTVVMVADGKLRVTRKSVRE